MASNINAAPVIASIDASIEKTSQTEVQYEARIAGNCCHDEVHGVTPGHGSIIAVEKSCDQTIASDEQRACRRNEFDRLLLVSFGSVSPAYLFSSFPLND
jgi:hypothetical protein